MTGGAPVPVHAGGSTAPVAPSAVRRVEERWRQALPSLGVGLVLAYLVLMPLGFLVLSSFRVGGMPLSGAFTLQNYADVYLDPTLYPILLNTLVFVVGSVALALVIGGTLAWLVERTDMPARRLVRGIVVLPMGVPPILLAIAWIMLLSPRIGFFNDLLAAVFGFETAVFDIYSMGGMIFVEAIAVVPTTFLILSVGFRNMDPALEEAAFASGAGGIRVIRRIFLPLMTPVLLSAAVFISVAGFVVFDIPGAIGMPARIFVLSSQIYYWGNETPTGLPLFGRISALAAVFLLVLLGLGLLYQRVTRHANRYSVISGKAYQPRSYPLGRWRYAGLALAGLYFIVAVAAPLAVLLWTSLMPYLSGFSLAGLERITLDNHLALLNNPRVGEAATNTLLVAVVAATVVTLFSAVVSWVVVRSRLPGRRTLDLLAFLPVSIPGVIIGVALIYTYLTLSFLPVFGQVWIIVIAYVTVYLSYGTRSLNGVFVQLHRDLEDAALASGASWLRAFRRVTLAMTTPALIAVWIWVAAHCGRELSAALMLQGRDNTVLSTLLWDYWASGQAPQAAATGVWLMLGLGGLIILWQATQRR